MKLQNHQSSAVRNALENFRSKKRGILLWHSAGSGKTLTSLTICKEILDTSRSSSNKVCIVVPQQGTLSDFQKEQDALQIARDKVTYLLIADFIESIKRNSFDHTPYTVIVIDECHKIIDDYMRLIDQLRTLPFLVLMTATPIQNDISDITKYVMVITKKTDLPDSKDAFILSFGKTGYFYQISVFIFVVALLISIMYLFCIIFLGLHMDKTMTSGLKFGHQDGIGKMVLQTASSWQNLSQSRSKFMNEAFNGNFGHIILQVIRSPVQLVRNTLLYLQGIKDLKTPTTRFIALESSIDTTLVQGEEFLKESIRDSGLMGDIYAYIERLVFTDINIVSRLGELNGYNLISVTQLTDITYANMIFIPVMCLLCMISFMIFPMTNIYHRAEIDMEKVVRSFSEYIDFYRLNEDTLDSCNYPITNVQVQYVPLNLNQIMTTINVGTNSTDAKTKEVLAGFRSEVRFNTDEGKEYIGRRISNISHIDVRDSFECKKFDMIHEHIIEKSEMYKFVIYSNFSQDLERLHAFLTSKGLVDVLFLKESNFDEIYGKFQRVCPNPDCKLLNLVYLIPLNDHCINCNHPLGDNSRWYQVLLLDSVFIEGISLFGVYKFIVMEPIIGADKQIQLYARVKRYTDKRRVMLPTCDIFPCITGRCPSQLKYMENFNCCRFDTIIVQMLSTANVYRNDWIRSKGRLLFDKVNSFFIRKIRTLSTSGLFTDKRQTDYAGLDGFLSYVSTTFDEIVYARNLQNIKYYDLFESSLNQAEMYYIDQETDSPLEIFAKAYHQNLQKISGWGRRIHSISNALKLVYYMELIKTAKGFEEISDDRVISDVETIIMEQMDDLNREGFEQLIENMLKEEPTSEEKDAMDKKSIISTGGWGKKKHQNTKGKRSFKNSLKRSLRCRTRRVQKMLN